MSAKPKLTCKVCKQEITKQVYDNCDGMCLECWDDDS
jgi:hypothetical protein